MSDAFANTQPSLSGPASAAFTVTPSDTADLSTLPRALYVGGDGNLTVIMQGGQTVTLTAVAAGTLLPLRVRRVLATGTSATAIVGLY